jgi:hypothetical protein
MEGRCILRNKLTLFYLKYLQIICTPEIDDGEGAANSVQLLPPGEGQDWTLK